MKKFIAGFIAGALLFGGIGAYAAGGNLIEVFYSVKDIQIEGESKMPSDVKLKPFTYNGRTFVPLNFVATNMGKKVTWDDSTKTVVIDEDESKYEEVLSVLDKYYTSYNEEDMDLHKSVLHSSFLSDTAYFDTIETLFRDYDYEYVTEGIEVLSMTNEEALVRVQEVGHKLSGPDDDYWTNYSQDLVFVLYKERGKWKIYHWVTVFEQEIFDDRE